MSELTGTCHARVRFGETDAAGIVYYPNFFQYFDLALQELLRTAPGNWTRVLREEGLGFPIAQSGATFRVPLFHDDEIAIVSRVTEVRTRAFRIEYRIERAGVLIAEGFEVRVYAKRNPHTRALEMQPFDPALRAWLLGTPTA